MSLFMLLKVPVSSKQSTFLENGVNWVLSLTHLAYLFDTTDQKSTTWNWHLHLISMWTYRMPFRTCGTWTSIVWRQILTIGSMCKEARNHTGKRIAHQILYLPSSIGTRWNDQPIGHSWPCWTTMRRKPGRLKQSPVEKDQRTGRSSRQSCRLLPCNSATSICTKRNLVKSLQMLPASWSFCTKFGAFTKEN